MMKPPMRPFFVYRRLFGDAPRYVVKFTKKPGQSDYGCKVGGQDAKFRKLDLIILQRPKWRYLRDALAMSGLYCIEEW